MKQLVLMVVCAASCTHVVQESQLPVAETRKGAPSAQSSPETNDGPTSAEILAEREAKQREFAERRDAINCEKLVAHIRGLSSRWAIARVEGAARCSGITIAEQECMNAAQDEHALFMCGKRGSPDECSAYAERLVALGSTTLDAARARDKCVHVMPKAVIDCILKVEQIQVCTKPMLNSERRSRKVQP